MTAPVTIEDRLQQLARELAEIRRRLDELERRIAQRGDHPTDQRIVREKAVYDWQQ